MVVETRFRWASYLAAIACITTRAPTLMTDGKVFELPLAINVGYVVMFGPVLVLIFYVDSLRSVRLAESVDDRSEDAVFKAVIFAPAILSLFLSTQYFLEVRPVNSCSSSWTALFGLTEFATSYCMDTAAQKGMPWLMNPPWLFSTAQIIVPLISLTLAMWTVRRVQAIRGSQHLNKEAKS